MATVTINPIATSLRLRHRGFLPRPSVNQRSAYVVYLADRVRRVLRDARIARSVDESTGKSTARMSASVAPAGRARQGGRGGGAGRIRVEGDERRYGAGAVLDYPEVSGVFSEAPLR